MSFITRENRLSVIKFAAVPPVLGLTRIVREIGSISTSSSRRAVGGDVDIDEGCILTKSVKYTHQLVHWVNSVLVERESSEEMESGEDGQGDTEMDQDIKTPAGFWEKWERHKKYRWLAGADLETRKAYGTALMCGHDAEYDPALFEDAFPDDEVHLYFDRSIVDAWQQGINSES